MINTYIADLKDDDFVAFTRKNADGTYTIILNARYNDERILEAYEHELKHIKSGDLDQEVSIQEAEQKVRGKLEETVEHEHLIFGIPEQEYRERSRKAAATKRNKLMAQLRKEQKRKETPEWVHEVRRKIGLE